MSTVILRFSTPSPRSSPPRYPTFVSRALVLRGCLDLERDLGKDYKRQSAYHQGQADLHTGNGHAPPHDRPVGLLQRAILQCLSFLPISRLPRRNEAAALDATAIVARSLPSSSAFLLSSPPLQPLFADRWTTAPHCISTAPTTTGALLFISTIAPSVQHRKGFDSRTICDSHRPDRRGMPCAGNNTAQRSCTAHSAVIDVGSL